MAFSTVITTPPICNLPKRISPRFKPTTIRVSSSASSISLIQLKSAQFDLKSYWSNLIDQLNQKLDEAIPVKYPEQIYQAMRYSVLAEGAKRAPPVMCIAACELFGVDRLAAFPTACALEMVCLFKLFEN